MARRKGKAAKFVPLALSAMVRQDRTRLKPYSQAEACENLDATDRTLRNWATKGMPTEPGPHGKPVYPVPDANIWALCYRVLVSRDPHGRGPARLSAAEATRWHLREQMEEWPEDFVLVPLDWDHPARQEMLQIAAAGTKPDPSED
jgi:hypothetical protein